MSARQFVRRIDRDGAGGQADEVEQGVLVPRENAPPGAFRQAHYATISTCSRRGPCAPRIRICAMSAEREGPVIMLIARGSAQAASTSRRYEETPYTGQP